MALKYDKANPLAASLLPVGLLLALSCYNSSLVAVLLRTKTVTVLAALDGLLANPETKLICKETSLCSCRLIAKKSGAILELQLCHASILGPFQSVNRTYTEEMQGELLGQHPVGALESSKSLSSTFLPCPSVTSVGFGCASLKAFIAFRAATWHTVSLLPSRWDGLAELDVYKSFCDIFLHGFCCNRCDFLGTSCSFLGDDVYHHRCSLNTIM